MKNICTFDTYDNMHYFGTAYIWWFKNGSEPNEEYECSCIYEMLTSEELYKMLLFDEVISIEDERFFKYCKVKGD